MSCNEAAPPCEWHGRRGRTGAYEIRDALTDALTDAPSEAHSPVLFVRCIEAVLGALTESFNEALSLLSVEG